MRYTHYEILVSGWLCICTGNHSCNFRHYILFPSYFFSCIQKIAITKWNT